MMIVKRIPNRQRLKKGKNQEYVKGRRGKVWLSISVEMNCGEKYKEWTGIIDMLVVQSKLINMNQWKRKEKKRKKRITPFEK